MAVPSTEPMVSDAVSHAPRVRFSPDAGCVLVGEDYPKPKAEIDFRFG
jgi:hypothetical protein